MADLKSAQTVYQAFIGQQDRLLKLTGPLGDETFLPQRVIAHERLGRGYEYTIDVISVRSDVELKKLVAQPVTLWVKQANRSYLPINGYVHTAKRLGSDGGLTFCQIAFAPWLYFLKFRKDARVWQDKKADDILAEVFSAHPQARGNFRFDLTEPVSRRSYCTQYETDWNFVHRLMEDEGWYSYHEQNADGTAHVLVVTDATHHLRPVVPQQIHFHRGSTEDELHSIVHWSANRTLKSSQLTLRTNDYKAPAYQKQSNTAVLAEHGRLPSQLEIYEYTGAYTYSRQEQGDKQSRIRVEEWESSIKRFYGVSGVRSLPVGRWFTLEGHPAHQVETEEGRRFMVVAVEWSIENNLSLANSAREFPGSLVAQTEAFKSGIGRDIGLGQPGSGESTRNGSNGHCFNRFEVQRRIVPFRSPLIHIKPELHPQTAIVVGPPGEEVHTDYLNRVKVQFRWDRQNPGDERASCWVRVSYPNAGQGWGGISVPRVGQEVIVTFLGGDPDRPVVTSRLYNQDQTPQWHTNGRLSGYKSKEFNGNGFNQLVLDDTTNQNRVQLYTTSAHAQLNLGYLITQQGNERTRFFGTGFALSTDEFGAIVTNKGLYISAYGRPGAQGTQLDATEASSQLKAGASLVKDLSETASKAGAEALAGQEVLGQFIDATQDRYEGPGQRDAKRFKEPIILVASPSGIGLTSAKGAHVNASDQVTLSSGKDTNIAAGKSLLVSVAEKISLFASNAGIKLFSGKGKVEVQAQANDLDLIAEKVVRLLSTTSRIEIHAKEEVVISAGGSFIKINASGITNGTSGRWISQASAHSFERPTTNSYVMPHLLKADPQKTDLEFRHVTNWGLPLAGAVYKATLSDGSVRKGTLDAQGIARISDVSAGTTAKIEYDYKPLQVRANVASELHEDIHQLLNWTPGSKVREGDA
ncbi:type VI secretion system Vgr family protein [Massilia sp. GER05]|uniref:type VI secretion system Vgr family protein n=1 Tax=Massilia sp. GER05 TaxID=3394605 RepID=UPI003F86F6DC